MVWTYIRGNQSSYSVFFQVNLIQVGMYMAVYYSLQHVFIPHLLNKGKIIHFIVCLITMSVLLYAFWRVMGILWLDDLRGFVNARPYKLSEFLLQMVQIFAPATILLTWESSINRQKELERIHQLEKEKLATELKFLKAQINPHFLFNTLNNLYSNVINKSPKAADMVMQLSSILNYVLNTSQNKSVPLSQEVQTIQNFMALEKIRYGERLDIDCQISDNLSLKISPLILLSLVENAFKHGASGDIDNPKIKIEIGTNQNCIRCKVWNTKSRYSGELNDAYKKGIGLKNIQRQLDLIYPSCHQLEIDNMKTYFNVVLTIQTQVV